MMNSIPILNSDTPAMTGQKKDQSDSTQPGQDFAALMASFWFSPLNPRALQPMNSEPETGGPAAESADLAKVNATVDPSCGISPPVDTGDQEQILEAQVRFSGESVGPPSPKGTPANQPAAQSLLDPNPAIASLDAESAPRTTSDLKGPPVATVFRTPITSMESISSGFRTLANLADLKIAAAGNGGERAVADAADTKDLVSAQRQPGAGMSFQNNFLVASNDLSWVGSDKDIDWNFAPRDPAELYSLIAANGSLSDGYITSLKSYSRENDPMLEAALSQPGRFGVKVVGAPGGPASAQDIVFVWRLDRPEMLANYLAANQFVVTGDAASVQRVVDAWSAKHGAAPQTNSSPGEAVQQTNSPPGETGLGGGVRAPANLADGMIAAAGNVEDQVVAQPKAQPTDGRGLETNLEVPTTTAVWENNLLQRAATIASLFASADSEGSELGSKSAIKPLMQAGLDASSSDSKEKSDPNSIKAAIAELHSAMPERAFFFPNVSASTTDPGSESIGLQITRELMIAAAGMPVPGRHSIRIGLHPKDLGEIDVQLVRDVQGRVSAHFVSEHDSTRIALSQNLDELRQALERAGVTVGQLKVGSQTSLGPGDAQSREGEPQANHNGPGNRTFNTAATEATRPSLEAERLLSLRA